MLRDTPDRIFLFLLCIVASAIPFVVKASHSPTYDSRSGGVDRVLEKAIAAQARVALLEKLYQPVEQLRKEGQLQAALLKLDEIGRTYPGETHGIILQGEILLQMNAFDQAVASFVRGVKLNGDYVDAKSPLSRRDIIAAVVKKGLADNDAASPGSGTPLRKNLFYLQSRLAGGCE